MKIGWIGLGMIGTAMVKRLLAAGFDVSVFERGQGLEEVRSAGAAPVRDYRELARAADLLVLCVFSDAQLREVLFEEGALEAMTDGGALAIHTTGSPTLMREIAAAVPAGVMVLDATFSGGPHDIEVAGLTLMVGGDEETLKRARPAFECYARNINFLGPVGSGQVVKLLNNLLFATNLMNAAKTLNLAGDQGFEATSVASIIGTCSGASYAMARFEAPLPPAALLDRVRPYLEKDVATAMAVAAEEGLDVSAFQETARYFRPSGA